MLMGRSSQCGQIRWNPFGCVSLTVAVGWWIVVQVILMMRFQIRQKQKKWVVLMGPRRVKLVSPEPSQAPAVATDILDRYRIYLEETVRILRAFGVKGVFGTIPILAQNLPPAFVQSYRLVFREMEKLTQKIDIPLIDVAAEFSKFPDKAVMFLPEDPVHLNAEGNRRVAEILLRGMLKRGLLPLEAK